LKQKTISFLLVFAMLSAILSGAAFALSETAPGTADATKINGRYGHGLSGKNAAKLMDSLVAEKIISRETADQLLSHLDKKAKERKAESQKIKSMTKEQRKAYFKSKKQQAGKGGFGSELVESGILTQKELDAINAYCEKQMLAKFEQKLESALGPLVKAGTITQSQKSAAAAYLKDRMAKRRLDMEKVKNMTDAERRAYFKEQKAKMSQEPFKELVENKTLTKAQADAIAKALASERKKK